jgi:chromosomal replication initiation ATPase DnaA
MTAEQLPFELGWREAFAREDFWVSECNRVAAEWIDRWPSWNNAALVIYGPPGCGKTHLGRVMQRKEGAGVLFIDDADAKAGAAEAEEEILHLFNSAREAGVNLLLTGKASPKDWNFVLPDLRSRILACPAAEVAAPDDQLMGVLLVKLFSDRQVFVGQDVVRFILARIERSFSSLRDVVGEIDRKSLSEKRPVTVPLVREMMQKKLL